ncbi:hypothetical protein HY339_01085 [Candidatus Gottesmanbacteria bacterium]|nr:hypothetical protein [Candidatus Gottesmanbacteria bacterium]
MALLLVSIACYLLTALVHVLLHRALAFGLGKITKNSFWVFVLGAVVTIRILYSMRPSDIPMSAILLYLLLSATHFLFFMSFFFDARSPSAKILFLIRRHGPVTREEIMAHFSDGETVVNRVNTLIYEGYIVERGNRFYASPKAIPIARFLAWYRRLMRWERGG